MRRLRHVEAVDHKLTFHLAFLLLLPGRFDFEHHSEPKKFAEERTPANFFEPEKVTTLIPAEGYSNDR